MYHGMERRRKSIYSHKCKVTAMKKIFVFIKTNALKSLLQACVGYSYPYSKCFKYDSYLYRNLQTNSILQYVMIKTVNHFQ